MNKVLRYIFGYIFMIKTSALASEIRTGEEYRLPESYSPLFYQVHISLTSNVFTNAYNEYSGQVIVFITVKNTTDFVALHAHHNFIKIHRIEFDNIEVSTANYTVDNITDILKINTSELTIGGVYPIFIEYTGILSTTDVYGFYKSKYIDENGVTKYLATTFFSPVHARKAFPCFDEPALKATFDFTFTVPTGLKVLFNTRQIGETVNTTSGLTTFTFNTTPKMSTFILAFIVSDYTCTSGASVDYVSYQVCSRKASSPTRELALEYGPIILENLNRYTNSSYGKFTQKMDQVAIPDFGANAMENWGLITYRETALLWDRSESSNIYKQRVITVMAHEIAHQWFGNLVTLYWWSAIFLKEGFATFFQYHTPHEILPECELDKQFVIEHHQLALARDAMENAHALHSDCYTPAEITSRFSTLSYSKGGSILRMVQHFMGKESFKAGIQNYVELNAYESVRPEDIWIALNNSLLPSVSNLPNNFTTVMENWINEPGYPVLYMSLDGNQVTISQKRFLLSGGNSATQWYVPISYSLSINSDKFERTSPTFWLTPNNRVSFTLPSTCEWIILNNQQSAYYRVNYDDTLWDKITHALFKDNFDGIGDLNRAQIVDDLFNLARADNLKYSKVFDIISFLAKDISYFAWYPAFSGFDFLLMRVGQDSSLGRSISATILELMRSLYNSVEISTLNSDDQVYTLKQILAYTWACRLGNKDCVQQIRVLFNRYKISGERPNKNLRSIIYCNGIKYSNDSSSDWNFLWERYVNTSDLATEQVTILSALGCTEDGNILNNYLNKSITESSGIRSQDALSVFSSVYTGSSRGVDVAFEFLVDNFEIIATRYNSMNSLGNLMRGIAERFTTESQLSRLRSFIEIGNLPEAFQVVASEALETVETNLKWFKNFEEDLIQYYENGATVTVTTFWILSLSIFSLSQNM